MDDNPQNITLSYDILVLDTIKKMRDTYAEDSQEKYYKYFEVAIQLVLPHLDIEIRKEVENDFKQLKKMIKETNAKDSNDQTKKIEILKLKEDFATTHRYYIMLALTKVGIVRASEEGLIDFNSIEIDAIKRAIRAGGGLPSALKEAKITKED